MKVRLVYFRQLITKYFSSVANIIHILWFKVFAALRFFSRGSYQASVGDNYLVSMSQSSVSRAVNKVAQGIYDLLLHQWVKFPDTDEKRNFIMRR